MSLEHEREPEDEYRVDKSTYDVSKFGVGKDLCGKFPYEEIVGFDEWSKNLDGRKIIYKNCKNGKGDRSDMSK